MSSYVAVSGVNTREPGATGVLRLSCCILFGVHGPTQSTGFKWYSSRTTDSGGGKCVHLPCGVNAKGPPPPCSCSPCTRRDDDTPVSDRWLLRPTALATLFMARPTHWKRSRFSCGVAGGAGGQNPRGWPPAALRAAKETPLERLRGEADGSVKQAGALSPQLDAASGLSRHDMVCSMLAAPGC